MKPRDSAPRTTSTWRPIDHSAIRSTAARSAWASCSSGMMSRKRMPGLGKSGIARILAARSIGIASCTMSSWERRGLTPRLSTTSLDGEASDVTGEQQLLKLRNGLGELFEGIEGFLALLAATRAQRRQHDLLDQAALAVDGTLHGAQVLGSPAGPGRAGGGGHHARLELGVAPHAAHLATLDELEFLELAEQTGVAAGELAEIFGGELLLARRLGHEVGLSHAPA